MVEKVNENSWDINPMPEEVVELNYTASYSKEEYEKMSYGFKPEMMEDKWFIYMKENSLFLHRSWTGDCIYKLVFTEMNDDIVVNKLIVNRNSEQYTDDETVDEYDIELVHFLINNILLGNDVPFPLPCDLPENDGVFQHVISGTANSEKLFKKKPWWKFW